MQPLLSAEFSFIYYHSMRHRVSIAKNVPSECSHSTSWENFYFLQILIDPFLTLEGWTDFPSHRTYGEGYMVTDELINWYVCRVTVSGININVISTHPEFVNNQMEKLVISFLLIISFEGSPVNF